MSKLSFLVLYIAQVTTTSGEIDRISDCSLAYSRTDVFRCINNGGGYLIWRVSTANDELGITLIYTHHPEGTEIVRELGASPITFEVLSANQSFMSGILSISKSVSVNGSTVTCNSNSITLFTRESEIPPSILYILHDRLTGIVNINWKPETACYYIYFNGSMEVISNASHSLPQTNATLEISISSSPDNDSISNFTIGSCIFRDTFHENRSYTLYQNGTWTILQSCANSTLQFNTVCNSTGIWTTILSCPVRHNTCTINQKFLCFEDLEITSSTPIKYIDYNYRPTSTVMNEEEAQFCQPHCTTAIASTAVLNFVTALIIGISLGLVCGIKCKQETRMKRDLSKNSCSEENESQKERKSIKTPEYEEVELEENLTDIEILQNVAYEQVQKI